MAVPAMRCTPVSGVPKLSNTTVAWPSRPCVAPPSRGCTQGKNRSGTLLGRMTGTVMPHYNGLCFRDLICWESLPPTWIGPASSMRS